MSRTKAKPMEIYVRHQSGPSSLLTFHLNEEQRLQLIAALTNGESIVLPAQLELSVLPQWVTNPDENSAHAVIPVHQISFTVETAQLPALSSLDTMQEVLRSFIATAVARRGDFLDKKITGTEAMQKDIEEARVLADLLNGKGPRAAEFFVQPWNSPEQMGAALKEMYGLDCTDEEAAFTMVMSMLNEVYGTVDYLLSNDKSVEENGWMIDGIVEMYAYAVLGLPWEQDEE